MRILNVGCGLETYGTDFIDRKPMRKGVLKCDADNERFPYSSETFDEVYMKGLFEHIQNHQHLLSECKRVLKKGGRISVITANAGLWGLFGTTHHGKYEKNSLERSKTYQIFTPNHVKNYLANAGFHNIKVSYGDDKVTRLNFESIALKVLSLLNKRLKPRVKATAFKR